MEEKTYSVSESVRLIGVESHVLRYWEEELHLPIQRNAQGHRIYSSENITLFKKVRDWKEKGLQLKAIRVLLERTEGLGVTENEIFERQVSEVFADEKESTVSAGKVPEIFEAVDNAVFDRKKWNASGETGAAAASEWDSAMFAEQISACDIEGDPCVGEVVPTMRERADDRMERITEVFRQIVREAAEEQNERLEQMLASQLREEARDLYLQYFQMLQEAAASKEQAEFVSGETVRRGKIRRILDILFEERI